MDQEANRTGHFWNSAKIAAKLDEIVDPAPSAEDRNSVKDAAYELSLGPEAYVSGAKKKTKLGRGDVVVIAPGQIALLLTEERVRVPRDVVAFISLKTSVKVPGLVNVSGFHVDPGFRGRLVFTVYNAGTEKCAFNRGQKMFLIWFAELNEEEPDGRHGSRQNQEIIPAADITRLTTAGASPAHLNERMNRLEIVGKIYGALLVAFFLTVATVFIRAAVEAPDRPAPVAADSLQEPGGSDPPETRN